MLCIDRTAFAQQYDNIYRVADADIVRLQGSNRIEYSLKGATILLPNGSRQINVKINIPYGIVDKNRAAGSDIFSDRILFSLKVDVDPREIQDYLTSSRVFNTHGVLSLNNITKAVEVSYIPMPSGTEEEGSFNLNVLVKFDSDDFHLTVPNGNEQFILKINDAQVNRL
ncbi:MAG TPA: hypothetical protein VK666_30095 [Chryseolinea sp.]|nr:hypothetical protein [Chryseolinea sp.]